MVTDPQACAKSRNVIATLWAVSVYIYTEEASMDIDISMYIDAKYVNIDVDMDGNCHIHAKPAIMSSSYCSITIGCSGCGAQ